MFLFRSSDKEHRISWFGRKKKSCNLKKYDKYSFIVGVEVTREANATQLVKLTVGHRYYHYILQLNKGARVSKQKYFITSMPP